MEDHAADVASAGGRGHVEGGDDQVGVVAGTRRVAKQAAGEEADDRGQVELSLTGDDLDHVPAPHQVRFLGAEVAVHEVRAHRPFTGPGRPSLVADFSGR